MYGAQTRARRDNDELTLAVGYVTVPPISE